MINRYETTLCYLYGPDGVLMMHRTKKEKDINKDKYIGVGGHIEQGESPDECVIREVKEETGLTLCSFRLRAVITFVIDDIDEVTFLYTSDDYQGEMKTCNEGDLVWVKEEKIEELPIWPGDKIFFRLLKERSDVFSLKLHYIHDELVSAAVDGKTIDFVV
ncbi:MAG: 8-oxo-dGTP diphosphatase [Lachnospiraceae bacterium]|nr:8-oxo-dGTP diphosphatase [Clostridiales bacterium]MBR6849438.1 8-oxo-dGTP diphosphatase [Lachnospiraceae bacterium]